MGLADRRAHASKCCFVCSVVKWRQNWEIISTGGSFRIRGLPPLPGVHHLHVNRPLTYRIIPKISPSKYKLLGACTWKMSLKYKVKQSKNGKFTSSYKVSIILFETQISLLK